MFSESEDAGFDGKDFDKMIRGLGKERNQAVKKIKIGRNDPCGLLQKSSEMERYEEVKRFISGK